MAALIRKVVDVVVIGAYFAFGLLGGFVVLVEFIQWVVRYEPWWR